MYLSKTKVIGLIKQKEIQISPYSEDSFGPCSYELHLSDNLFYVHPEKNSVHNGMLPKEKVIVPIKLRNNMYRLKPKEFIIAKSEETIKLSKKIAGIYDGKASLAQIGLFTHISSTHIDPGTNSTMTAEIYNASNYPIDLKVGMKIAQVIFVAINT